MSPRQDSSDWSLAKFNPASVTEDLLASLDIAEINLTCLKSCRAPKTWIL